MNIRDIKITPLMDSLQIKKISDEEYFSDAYSDYISNSRLGLINPEKQGTPEKFFNGLNAIYSDSLLRGSAIHELYLQPEYFELAPDLQRPTAKMGFVADYLYSTIKQGKPITQKEILEASNEIGYFAGKLNDARIYEVNNKCLEYLYARYRYENDYLGDKTPIFLDSKSMEIVNSCLDSLKRNKQIDSIMNPIGLLEEPIKQNEQAILLNVLIEIPDSESFVFKLKSKLDNFTIDFDTNTVTVNDVKTIGKILSEFDPPNGNFAIYSYAREIAMYSWLLSLVSKREYNMVNPKIESNCLVVSTIPPYYTKVYNVTTQDFNKGWNEFKYLLRLAAYYYSKGYKFN